MYTFNSYILKYDKSSIYPSFAQEAHVEVLQMCEDYSWLVDVHLFTSQWSRARLEAPRSCDHFGQQVLQVRSWQEKLPSVPAFYTTSNNLLTVYFSHLLENTGRLPVREED